MGALIGSLGMSNVLSEEKKQQVIALGKLGWPLRRIEQATARIFMNPPRWNLSQTEGSAPDVRK
jgi:hypothetical protein